MKNKIVIVSACLVGLNTKYNGKNNLNRDVLNVLKNYMFVPLCPEQLGGLPTPRPPAEIIGSKIININGINITESFLRGAKEALKFAEMFNVRVAILKEGSPSCGVNYVYDGTFTRRRVKGMGITTALFRKSGIKVFSENNLKEFLDEEK